MLSAPGRRTGLPASLGSDLASVIPAHVSNRGGCAWEKRVPKLQKLSVLVASSSLALTLPDFAPCVLPACCPWPVPPGTTLQAVQLCVQLCVICQEHQLAQQSAFVRLSPAERPFQACGSDEPY